MLKHMAISLMLTGMELSILSAQPAPPPPPPAAYSGPTQSLKATISQSNYGPDGEIDGFVCSNGALLRIPPQWASQLESVARPGEAVTIQGYVSTAPSGMQVIEAQSLSIAGHSFSVVPPSQPVPYASKGVIKRLNYGPAGDVNGFVCSNGVFARTPPSGTGSDSVLKPGANIAFSGFEHTTPFGKTVVDVQSITVNGQTIAMNVMPPDPTGPAERGPRGPRGAVPPPPPAAPQAQ